MSVELKWVPTWEASDHRAKGWSEVLLHDGGCEEGHFLMASPVEEEAQQTKPEDQALVVCPNCGNLTSESHAGNYLPWICTKPEPAAPVEIPEVVADALIALRSGAFPNLANDLETFWRSREQQHRFEIKTLEAKYDNERTLRERDARTLPAPGAGTVGMTRELGMVEDAAAARALWHLDNGQRQQFNEITNAISALRAQAAKVQVVPVEATIPVGVWQLEELLKYADLAEVALRTGFHPPEFLFTPADRSLRQCIEAVKEQRDRWLAAEGGR